MSTNTQLTCSLEHRNVQPSNNLWAYLSKNASFKTIGITLGLTTALLGYPLVSAAVDAPSNVDFGDAPSNIEFVDEFGEGAQGGYPPTSHIVPESGATLWLGIVKPDVDTMSQPDISFVGDDEVGIDDEDGIKLDESNAPIFTLLNDTDETHAGSFDILVNGSAGKLDAFIDFNADGDWKDAGESLFFTMPSAGTTTNVGVGDNTVGFAIPEFLVSETSSVRYRAGLFGLRLRLSTAGGLDASGDGPAADGEIEDHLIEIQSALSIANLSLAEGSGEVQPGTIFNVIVSTDKINNQDVVFTVSTTSGTAIGGSNFAETNADFITQTGVRYALRAGQKSVSVPITVSPDYVAEEDETFTVNIALATGEHAATVADSVATVTILNDDNDQPQLALKPGKVFTTPEEAGLTISLNDFVVTDRDTGDRHTLWVDMCASMSLQSKGAVTQNYTVSGTTVTPAKDFFGEISLDVCVDDGSGKSGFKDSGYHGPNSMSDPLTITITVTPVNDAPTLAPIDSPAAVNEDAGEQTVNATGITTGAANENDTLAVTATSNNTGLILNPTVTYTSPNATAEVKYTPVANASGTATITVTVNDGQAANNTTSQTFNVVVSPVQDAPTIAKGRTISTLEDTPITLLLSDFITADVDGDSLTLLLDSSCIREASATVSNKRVVVAAKNYSVEGLKVTPTLNYFSEAGNAERPALSLIACVQDSANNISSSVGFTIAVNSVNDLPVITAQRTLKTNNEQPIFLEPLHFSIVDVDDDRFTLKVLPGENYTVNGTSITPKAGFVGDLAVPVKANDGEADSATFNATVSVAAATKARVKLTTDRTLVEEGDSIILTASLDQKVDSKVDLTLTFTGLAIFGTDYTVGSLSSKLVVEESSSSTVTLTIPAGQTSAEIEFQASTDSEVEPDELIVISTDVSANAEPAIPVVELTIVGTPDGDGDRIDEAAGVDGNGDDQDDRVQSNVATTNFTYRAPGSNESVVDTVTLAAIDSAKPTLIIRNVEIRRLENTVPQQQLQDLEAEGVTIPDDLLAFDLLNVGTGGCTTADVILPNAPNLPEYTTYYKYGKEKPTDTVASLYEFDFDTATQTGAKFSKKTINGKKKIVITLHLCDGKRGDSDGLVNDRISDPGFPAINAATGGKYGGGAIGGLTVFLLGLFAFMRAQGCRIAALKWVAMFAALGSVGVAQAAHQELDGSTAIGGGLGYLWQDDDRRPDTQHSNGFVGRIHYNWDHYQASFLTLCYQANQSECKSMYGLGVDVIRDDELTQGLDSRLGVGFGLGMTERSNDNRFDLTPYIHGQIGLVKDLTERWAGTASVHAIYTMDGRTAASENAYDDVFVMLGAERRFGKAGDSSTTPEPYYSEPASARLASFGSVDFGFAKTDLNAITKLEAAHIATSVKGFLVNNPQASFTAHGYSDIGSKGEANAIRLATGRAERLKAALLAHGVDAAIAIKAHAVKVPNLDIGRLHRKAELK